MIHPKGITNEQIDGVFEDLYESGLIERPLKSEQRAIARAIESAVLNSDDSIGAVGKGVQPPDGTTERWKLLTHDLASMLVFGGFMPAEAQDDPEGYDNCRTMEKVGYLCDLINGRMSEAVCAEPSMSTTSPPENSGTDETKLYVQCSLHQGQPYTLMATGPLVPYRRVCPNCEREGGAKP